MPWPRISFPRFGGLFAAPPGPAPTARQREGDQGWQAGDQAECINGTGIWFWNGVFPAPGPQQGEVRVVEAALVEIHTITGQPAEFLRFARYGNVAFEARCFRKVTPRADEAIAGDAATLDELLGKPAHPEPVEGPVTPAAAPEPVLSPVEGLEPVPSGVEG